MTLIKIFFGHMALMKIFFWSHDVDDDVFGHMMFMKLFCWPHNIDEDIFLVMVTSLKKHFL